MAEVIAQLVFWVSFAGIVYTYAGYPALLSIHAILAGKPRARNAFFPPITVLICAYNEVQGIRRKIDNLLDQDYPGDQLEIVVVSDGSTDGTDEAVRAVNDRRVKLVRPYGERSGKALALNAGLAAASGDFIVFSDVRQALERDAIRQLLANFADPKVGAVSGELHLVDDHGGTIGAVGAYWKYEKFIRKMESVTGSSIGATGALYAIRKELFRPLKPGIILDDVVTPMNVLLQGYQVIFEPAARVYDRVAASSQAEWFRKVRTQAGNWQLFTTYGRFFSPVANPALFQFLSHKIFRLVVPFLLVFTLVANLLLREGIYALALAAQVVFYGAFLVSLLPGPAWLLRLPVVKIPHVFVLLNAASVAGLYKFLTGSGGVWRKG